MSQPLRVRVDIEGAAYDVVIGRGLLGEAGDLMRESVPGRRVALVSDSRVAELCGEQVIAALSGAGYDVFPYQFAAGESSKNWQVVGDLLEALAKTRLDRTDIVVALGGGVVGDVAGFAAATYLRGVRFVQMPTTLLAQVDSSVGGKTGVDLAAGKNLAGAFKQPYLVIADVDVLASLPEGEWRSGLAEVAKSAVIDGGGFTAWLEDNAAAVLARRSVATGEAVRRCIAFKSRVVAADRRDESVRECLNYGHTLGHAVENVAGYGVIPHGLAVAEGMRFVVRLAVEVAGASREFVRRQDALLDALGLDVLHTAWPPDELLAAMHSDKKSRSGSVRFVLADGPGSWTCSAVEDRVIREHLEAWADSKRKD